MGRDRGERLMFAPMRNSSRRAHHIAVGELGAAAADRLDFPAVEREARLVALLDEIVVERFRFSLWT